MEHVAFVAALKAYRVGLARLGFPPGERRSNDPIANEERMAEWVAGLALNEVVNENHE